eukprot:scaffold369552_cov16-Prasinocladus_malaysianus.AAC.1
MAIIDRVVGLRVCHLQPLVDVEGIGAPAVAQAVQGGPRGAAVRVGARGRESRFWQPQHRLPAGKQKRDK